MWNVAPRDTYKRTGEKSARCVRYPCCITSRAPNREGRLRPARPPRMRCPASPGRRADTVMCSLGFFNCITLNSQHMQREYARYPASYRSRIKHVAHGFDDKALDLPKEIARKRFGLPCGTVLLGCAARLHPHKQLDAAIRLLAAQASWHLALAGQGADEPRLRRLAAELKVSDRLHFV